ncbi:hypothetical protein V3O24_06795 [Methylobacter sp. Wu8]|uniref:MORN repeat protein n=1 Tax=Methylobacter tundripaludum TaxID=173365 RepID=A0A2S6H5J3_9GAMM|nr:hypothetical protein [Methylobacter tundripaludum]MCK9636122.1 hypothetical protein [Methylobacter tundripaludum]PPK72713.1 hypothetical protein B0F88_103146 [Methylobacter tundripaludum]
MKKIIFLLTTIFFISDCNADIRVLEQLRAQAHQRAKQNISQNKKPKKAVKTKKTVKPKEIVLKDTKPKEIVTSADLDIRNELAYLPNEDKPFSGRHEMHHSNGKRYVETKYKDGKRDGLLIMWDEYGYKIGELNFADGNQL